MTVAKHFLLVFDRPHGQLLDMVEYADAAEALRARFSVERTYRQDPTIEVVVLTAESEATLHRTHARYFDSARQIIQNGLRRLDALQVRPAS
jgi:hypothetical protein